MYLVKQLCEAIIKELKENLGKGVSVEYAPDSGEFKLKAGTVGLLIIWTGATHIDQFNVNNNILIHVLSKRLHGDKGVYHTLNEVYKHLNKCVFLPELGFNKCEVKDPSFIGKEPGGEWEYVIQLTIPQGAM